ncbi:hypothetical protein LX32DRAFT_690341 [Colletotrichum zoysiae]|uniref:Uncharacterized protein n=1 Tax=Colletotrichum zoysiae TaxID=1216348 RepID=A0AAD9HQF4_9PEZI|nr:hypothetical protein LX32DRAFT_690341 [Colletotrichum zoysiae]
MSDGLVKLRTRGNYELWKGCLHRFPGLTKQQKSMLFHAPADLATGDEGHARQYKDISRVYSILIDSLDDRVCSGLSAHGKLRHGQKPWELYHILEQYCNPTPSFAVSLIKDLERERIDDFATPMEFAAYVDFIRLCVEGDGYSMALTCILYRSVEESIYEDYGEVHPVTKAMDWTELLDQVRELTHYKKRPAGDSLQSLDQGSGRVNKAIEADAGDNGDEVGV